MFSLSNVSNTKAKSIINLHHNIAETPEMNLLKDLILMNKDLLNNDEMNDISQMIEYLCVT